MEGIQERTVLYTQQEEREMTVNLLQSLPVRHFVVSAGPLAGTVVKAVDMPDATRLPGIRPGLEDIILSSQRERIEGSRTGGEKSSPRETKPNAVSSQTSLPPPKAQGWEESDKKLTQESKLEKGSGSKDPNFSW